MLFTVYAYHAWVYMRTVATRACGIQGAYSQNYVLAIRDLLDSRQIATRHLMHIYPKQSLR